jgi:acyl-CoA thioester hydrolase
MNEGKAERRDAYPYGAQIATRWGDIDSYGHVNNVVYYAWFDTLIGEMLADRQVIHPYGGPTIGLCVASGCEFYAAVHFPQEVEARLRIGRLGDKSLRYEIGIFLEGQEAPAATGFFVHAFVDPKTRAPTALTADQKHAVADLCA